MRGIDLSSVHSVASTSLVKNLNAEYLNGNKNYFPKKSLNATLESGKWYRIASINMIEAPNSDTAVFSLIVDRVSQSVSYLVSYCSCYDSCYLIQIGSGGGSNNTIKIRIVRRTATEHYLEVYNSFSGNYRLYFTLLDLNDRITLLSNPTVNDSDANVMQALTCERYPNTTSATSSQLSDSQIAKIGGGVRRELSSISYLYTKKGGSTYEGSRYKHSNSTKFRNFNIFHHSSANSSRCHRFERLSESLEWRPNILVLSWEYMEKYTIRSGGTAKCKNSGNSDILLNGNTKTPHSQCDILEIRFADRKRRLAQTNKHVILEKEVVVA